MSFLLAKDQINVASFDRNSDPIAVVLKSFTLKKKADSFLGVFGRFSEPYIVSVAIDENGAANPKIDFSVLPFPNVRKGDKISFDGQGHLIYGPKHPGSFITYSILFMESDSDIKELGATIERIIASKAVDIGAKALLAAVPTSGTAISIVTKLIELIAAEMQKNKDDTLFRREGTFLRDLDPPYDVLRTFTGSNDFIECDISVLPLVKSNNLGSQTQSIIL